MEMPRLDARAVIDHNCFFAATTSKRGKLYMLDRRKFLHAGFGFGLTCVFAVGQFRPDADLAIALETDFFGRINVGRLATMIGNELTEKELAFFKAFFLERVKMKRGPATKLFVEHGRPYPLVLWGVTKVRGKIDLIDLLETEYSEDKEVEWPWANQNNYDWQ